MSAVVVFRSKASGEVILLRRHVEPVFEAAQWPLHEMGAVDADDVQKLLRALQVAIDALEPEAEDPFAQDDEEDPFKRVPAMCQSVGLRRRFYPLFELMRAAIKKAENVRWEPM